MKSPRRRFLKTLALAPVVPAALVAPASAQAPAAGAARQAPGGSGEDVAEALTEAVRRQFGEHLNASELEEVRREIGRMRGAAERLRASARLANADDPVTRFEARPPAARGGREP